MDHPETENNNGTGTDKPVKPLTGAAKIAKEKAERLAAENSGKSATDLLKQAGAATPPATTPPAGTGTQPNTTSVTPPATENNNGPGPANPGEATPPGATPPAPVQTAPQGTTPPPPPIAPAVQTPTPAPIIPPVVVDNTPAPETNEERLAREQREEQERKDLEAQQRAAEKQRLHELNVRNHGEGYITAKNGEMQTIFSRKTWDLLGVNKNGWKQVIAVPDEVAALNK